MTVHAASAGQQQTSLGNDVMEWAGFACLAAFAFFVWPPLTFLVAGLVLVVTANLRDVRARPDRVRLSERLVRALQAWRAAGR